MAPWWRWDWAMVRRLVPSNSDFVVAVDRPLGSNTTAPRRAEPVCFRPFRLRPLRPVVPPGSGVTRSNFALFSTVVD